MGWLATAKFEDQETLVLGGGETADEVKEITEDWVEYHSDEETPDELDWKSEDGTWYTRIGTVIYVVEEVL